MCHAFIVVKGKRAIKRRERYASMVYRSPKLMLFVEELFIILLQ